MIYTLTLNTAIDMNVITNKYLPNTVNRTESVKYSPNGKGINVSIVLEHFNVKSKIIGVFGGFTGRYIVDELCKKNIEVLPVWVEEPTRINVFTSVNNEEYKLVSPGSFVNKEKQEEIKSLLSQCKDMDTLVICGSLPPGISPSFYDEIIDLVKNKHNAEIILDISSEKLKDLLKYNPLLIKPNDEELKEVFGFELGSIDNVKNAMKSLHEKGVKQVLLTLGGEGLYYSDGEKVFYCEAPKIELLSSACAGDSCLAAFMSGIKTGLNIEDVLKRSSATGANVAESEGIGLLDKVDDYTKLINVIKL